MAGGEWGGGLIGGTSINHDPSFHRIRRAKRVTYQH